MNKKAPLEFDDARTRLLSAARRVKGEDRVSLADAVGRVLAEPVVSPVAVPPLDNSAMDGYALCCEDVTQPGIRLPVAQRIPAGSIGQPLRPGTAARIFTGAPVPDGADAVVMQEHCEADLEAVIVGRVPRSGENIRRRGEDMAKGAEVLPTGTLLTPQAIGLAAATGAAQLAVLRRLSVAVLATGDELAAPGQPLKSGQIYNSNKPLLLAMLKQMGCAVEDLGDVPDTLEATRKALRKAGALHDLVITTGGVSVGEEDHVRRAVEAEGEIALWKVAIKPGKPLAFGRVGAADFVGLPGNPVSAFVTFLLLIASFIRACQGIAPREPQSRQLPAGFDWLKPGDRREFLRARIGTDGRVELFPNQSSGVLTSVVWADGLVDNPAGQVIRTGDPVRFISFSELT
jgi:molybdopterin molybdotransferase